jgi:6-phosphogluconolactonase
VRALAGGGRLLVGDVGADAGRLVVAAIQAAVDARGRASLALPGGTGPVPLLRWFVEGFPAALAEATVVTWVDERHLATPADSNRRLAWDRWWSNVAVRPSEVPLDADGPLDAARAAVEAAFVARVGRLDVAVLGVGPDGHVASLFPGHPVADADGVVLAVADAPKPPPERLTLSKRVLLDAGTVVVVAAGAAKAPILARGAAGDPSVPIGWFTGPACTWVLDAAAAG